MPSESFFVAGATYIEDTAPLRLLASECDDFGFLAQIAKYPATLHPGVSPRQAVEASGEPLGGPICMSG